MAPKKLTDSPENLREAIDWLIQIRHAGDGKGLEKLAEALKNLITKAIDDARESLEKREKQLLCAERTSDEYFVYCAQKDNDIESKIAKIGTLEEALKAKDHSKIIDNKFDLLKLENDVSKVKSEKEKHYNEVHSLSDDARKKSLGDIYGRKKRLKDLQIRLKAFVGEKEGAKTPKDILKQLCDGLEKFLGFNSDSKGYDGQGIVYSDLDRLCDGVMAFLKGVLDAVKVDKSITTYWKDVISDLGKMGGHLQKGQKGLEVFLDLVGSGLGNWNVDLNGKTKNVTIGLENLINTKIGRRYLNDIDDSHRIQFQLTNWTMAIGDIEKDVKRIEDVEITKLDLALKNKLMHEMKPIRSAIEVLKESAWNADFVKQTLKVDAVLVEKRDEINKEIEKASCELNSIVDEKVRMIHEKLTTVVYRRKKGFENINKLMKDAHGFLNNDFDSEYKDRVTALFSDIRREVEIVHADLILKKAQLHSLVDQARSEFETLKDKVQGKNNSVNSNWLELTTQIGILVTGLTGINERKPGTLQQIVNGVKEYADTFDKKTFENSVLSGWVHDGLKDAAVSGYINMYVGANKTSHSELNKNGNEAVKQAIVATLPGLIEGIIKQTATAEGLLAKSTAVEKLSQIGDKFGTFAKTIKSEFAKNVKEAANKVEQQLRINGKLNHDPDTTQNLNLIYAIQNTLISIATTASKVAFEIKQFINISTISKGVEAAIQGVNDIGAKIDTGDDGKQFGLAIKNALVIVGQKIDALGNILQNNGTIMTQVDELDTILKTLHDMKKNGENEEDGKINGKSKNAYDKIENLKTELNNKFNHFNEVVKRSTDAIEDATQSVRIALNEAHDKIKKSVDGLRAHLIHFVSLTFAEVTNQVQKLFADSHRANLVSLQKLIDAQLDTVNKIIQTDMNNGTKGLIKTVIGIRTIVNPGGPHRFDESDGPTLLNPLKTFNGATNFDKISDLSTKFATYMQNILLYLELQVKNPQTTSRQPMDAFDESIKVWTIKCRLDALLNYLCKIEDNVENGETNTKRVYTFDSISTRYISELNSSIVSLYPAHFASFHNPLLFDVIKRGMERFTDELQKSYVNKYEGSKAIEWEKSHSEMNPPEKKDPKDNLSEDAMRCARIFLTCIPEWNWHLPYLRTECISGSSKKRIFLFDNTKQKNTFGHWFKDRGFTVSDDDNTQSGELDRNCTGSKIGGLFNHQIKSLNKDLYDVMQRHGLSTKDSTTLTQIFSFCYDRLDKYRQVCHIQYHPTAKAPTTINQMLHWLTGLYYTPMYEALRTYLETWFKEFIKEHEINKKTLSVVVPERTRANITQEFDIGNLLGSFQNVTIRPADILLTILGYGDADGRYACDFFTNPYDLDYPTDVNKCFDLLVEICLRLNHQLRFLYSQCHNGTSRGGWGECWYGKNIGGSRWNCNTMQSPEQKSDQDHKQSCERKCEQIAKCGLKSPLQSFLEDGLPGFLPHQFSAPSCNLTCSVRNHRGIPCKTPMGFADISVTASWTRTGDDIKKILDPFCGTLPHSLSMLCSYFLLLLRRPPQTLCDMFGFYHNYLEHWSGDGATHKGTAFTKAVKDANFGNANTTLAITTIQVTKKHMPTAADKKYIQQSTHAEGDLFGLVCCKENDNPVYPCGSYLQPLSLDIRCVFTHKLAADYLSWIVYLTEPFYDLLRDLYTKCNKCCTQQVTKCYGRVCANGCAVDSTTEAAESKKGTAKTHKESCNSIVKCPSIHPVIYAAGFTFGSPWSLSGENGVGKTRSCKDFCEALGLVVQKYNLLYNLVNKHIPDFLWAIRSKFFWTTVALWLLSLLYLLHIMVIRLDLLHIKSHLHSPSSHRIAAQSLLAAGRVKALNKVFYLQP